MVMDGSSVYFGTISKEWVELNNIEEFEVTDSGYRHGFDYSKDKERETILKGIELINR